MRAGRRDRAGGVSVAGSAMEGSPFGAPRGCVSPGGRAAFQVHLGPICQLSADLPGASSLGPGQQPAFGNMFPPPGGRRGFPREPGPWRAGPPWPHGPSPQDIRDEPPWKPPHRRGHRGRHPPHPWEPRPFRGPADFHEDGSWAPQDCPPPPPWDNWEDNQGPEDHFGESWHPPGPWDPRDPPGPPDFPWKEEDRRWAPHDCPPWVDTEYNGGPEGSFAEDCYLDPPPPGPGSFSRPEFPAEEQWPPWPPGSQHGEQGGFQDGWSSGGYRGLGKKRCRRLRQSCRQLTMVRPAPCHWPARGKQPPFKSNAPRPLPSSKDAAQHKEQTPPVGPPGVSEKVPEPPKAADTPQDSLAAGPQAAAAGAEPEQAGVTPVEPGAGQDPEGSQDPSALQTEEESSARTGQHPEVEPSSPSVPEAGAGGGSRPQTPTAPTEPAQRVCAATGEGDAELCPQPPGRQRLPGAAGAAEAGSAHHGLLSDLQTPENSPVPAGAAAEPGAQPGQAGSDSCTAPVTSPGTWHPPGSAETEPAADGQHQLCSVPPASSPAGTDLRSATVLARKEEIELSYQQFSLTVAVVATMLLQKEPSMEAALGLALRANLRQRRLHHLRELENFIDSYDSAALSR
ncbi:collagen alpha-1(I) chain-like isoform X3 [Columba livia]|uniref:collagen alpha-1(I) chain-like isoform X3 n=1 Tax=Columba livia TaxID=8932 RepID=UPI0031BA5DD6